MVAHVWPEHHPHLSALTLANGDLSATVTLTLGRALSILSPEVWNPSPTDCRPLSKPEAYGMTSAEALMLTESLKFAAKDACQSPLALGPPDKMTLPFLCILRESLRGQLELASQLSGGCP